jgi:hypothetical protein
MLNATSTVASRMSTAASRMFARGGIVAFKTFAMRPTMRLRGPAVRYV